MRQLRRSMPYVIAAVIALNGFSTLIAGLVRIFRFTFYLGLELDAVTDYLDATPDPQLGGFVSVFLGGTLIALGKGLAERRRRFWWMALAVLGLLLLNNLYQGLPFRNSVLSVAVLVLLAVFRRDFVPHPERHHLNYAELVAIISVLLALSYGIVGSYLMRREFSTIESWTDAVYFTVVTYSTLGYGDILPQTPNAKIFTMSMVFIGLSSFVTALTVLLGPLIEQRMKGVLTVMSKFQKTADHVVICGFTNVTESIVDELRERDIPFLIIDERESMILHIKSKGLDALHGDPTEKAILEQANLPRAAAVIAATDSDATNTLVALTARDLRELSEENDFRIIVRIEDEENIEKVRHIGADEVVSPSTAGGRMMANKDWGLDYGVNPRQVVMLLLSSRRAEQILSSVNKTGMFHFGPVCSGPNRRISQNNGPALSRKGFPLRKNVFSGGNCP